MVKPKKRKPSPIGRFSFLLFFKKSNRFQQNENDIPPSARFIYEKERQQRMSGPVEHQCIDIYNIITVKMMHYQSQRERKTIIDNTTHHTDEKKNEQHVAQHRLVSPREQYLNKQQKNQRNKESSSTATWQPIQLYEIFPSETLYQILAYLDPNDIIELTGVNQGWFLYMIQWSIFWKLSSSRMPSMDQSKLNTLLYNIDAKEQEGHLPVVVRGARLDGPLKIHFVDNILKCLLDSHNPYLEKLTFSKLSLRDYRDVDAFQTLQNLIQVIKSKRSHLKEIEFIDYDLPIHIILNDIMPICSNMSRITFSTLDNKPVDARCGALKSSILPKKIRISIVPWFFDDHISEPFKYLTYLQFAFQDYDALIDDCTCMTTRLCGILRWSPQLEHLYLESGGDVRHGDCIDYTIRYCPQLVTLVLSPGAKMPPSILDPFMDTGNDSNVMIDEKKGKLKRLIMVGGDIKVTPQHLINLYQRHHTTLAVIHLHYNGEWSEPSSISELALLGAPRLRIIQLESRIKKSKYSKVWSPAGWQNTDRPLQQALENLFSTSLSIQAIQLTNQYYTKDRTEPDCHIRVDDPVLEAIAKNCLHLRYLDLSNVYGYSHPKGIIQFATILGKRQQQYKYQLEYLKVYIGYAKDTALKMVNQLSALKQLCIINHPYFIYSDIALNPALQIMKNRGGNLIVETPLDYMY